MPEEEEEIPKIQSEATAPTHTTQSSIGLVRDPQKRPLPSQKAVRVSFEKPVAPERPSKKSGLPLCPPFSRKTAVLSPSPDRLQLTSHSTTSGSPKLGIPEIRVDTPELSVKSVDIKSKSRG
eukprot:sb/3476020/